jgi:hypothetical protein
MPTIKIIGPYRFFFYSNEGDEPPHVHVERDNAVAKFWLNPVGLVRNSGFPQKEIRDIRKLVERHQGEWLKAWNEHFKH